MKYLNEEVGFWESDVGYCEIYIYFGVIGLLGLFFGAMVFMILKSRNLTNI